MRLLNVRTREFACFDEKSKPPYAIASHRWEENEATYQEVIAKGRSSGCEKVWEFCRTVVSMNGKTKQSPAWKAMGYPSDLEWLWIDTACIDKTNNVELSEAINSMCNWYRCAAVCYAYLSDVKADSQQTQHVSFSIYDFLSSEWFKRGWTLQELLAPGVVVFLAANWTILGHKCPYVKQLCDTLCRGYGTRLNSFVSRITELPSAVVDNWTNLSSVALEERLVWIKGRKTTRAEDKAYCMLGICDISMVPIYGEGERSWSRLLRTIREHDADMQNRSQKPSRSTPVGRQRKTGDPNRKEEAGEVVPLPIARLINRGQIASLEAGRNRAQITWDATVDAETNARSKTQGWGPFVETKPPSRPHWTWKHIHDSSLGLVATASTESMNPADRHARRQRHNHSADSHLVQCGSCHGNIYTNDVVICTNRYCRTPAFHQHCIDNPRNSSKWLCQKCRRTAQVSTRSSGETAQQPENTTTTRAEACSKPQIQIPPEEEPSSEHARPTRSSLSTDRRQLEQTIDEVSETIKRLSFCNVEAKGGRMSVRLKHNVP